MATTYYPTDATAQNFTPQIIMDWWTANSQWAMPLIAVLILIFLVITAIMIVSTWKIFEKAGKKGWAAIVPFYSQYVFLEVIGRPVWMFWVWLGFIIADAAIPPLNAIGGLVIFVLTIIWALDLAKVFGQNVGFGVANIFFPVVTYPILAFNKTITYAGTENGTNTSTENSAATKTRSNNSLAVILVVVILVVMVIVGIISGIIVGVVGSSSRGAAINECRIAFAQNIRDAAGEYKNTTDAYPLTISNIGSNLLDKNFYQPCENDVTYASDGKVYTILSTLDDYTGNDPNVINGVYTLTK